MDTNRTFHKVIACMSCMYILYTLITHYIVDPGAETFLSYKTGLEHKLNPSLWLSVMYVHVGFACVSMASGIINLTTRSYDKHRPFHRLNGYVYVISVLLVVLTSGYMAPYATGGKINSMGFNLVNILWLAITVSAIVHIRNKRIIQHRRWMIRSYAFCFTNLLIHLLTFVLHQWIGIAYVTSYTIGLYGTIVLLIAAPEVMIRAQKRRA